MFARLSSFIGALFRRKSLESQMDAEMHFHLETFTEDLVRSGVSRDDAERRAAIEFGGIEVAQERCRQARGLRFLDQLRQDAGYAIRMLSKNRGFTVVAVLTLALGIGANTAIFSVVQGVVLSPLPYTQPERLVIVLQKNYRAAQLNVTYPDFQDWQHNSSSFQEMAAFNSRSFNLTDPGAPEHLEGKEVSSTFFTTLGVKVALGRDFSPQEDQQGGAPVAIISDRLWQNHFSGRPAAPGEVIILDGYHYTIVGILPSGFRFFDDADIYTPIGQGDPQIVNDRTIHAMAAFARLKPGLSAAQAQADMSTVQNNLDELYPNSDRGLDAVVVPLKKEIIGNVDGTLLILLGAAGVVLLIACANVASLLLARSAARSREFAIRAALGASRSRIVWQLVTESMILSFVGGSLGLAIAKWGIKPLLTAVPGSLPRSENIGVNATVLIFTFGVSIAVGILFGLAPAIRSSKTDLRSSLSDGGRSSSNTHHRAQNILVIVQMALTLVLLLGAGLLFRTIRNLWNINPGFDTQHIVTFKVGLSPSSTETPSNIRVSYRQMIERIQEIPGVESADSSNIVPLSGEDNGTPFWAGAQRPASMAEAPRLLMFWSGPDYLKTMGIRLLQGRFLSPEDTINSAPVIVIDSVLAHAYFPDSEAVGQTISIAHWGTVRIVGVVGHVTHWGLDRPNFYTQNQAYGSFYQIPEEFVKIFENQTVIVRTQDVASVMPEIKNVIYGTNKDQPVYQVQTMQEVVSRSMSSQRLPMILLGSFAGLALLLASVGIYGAISYSVTLRLHEIGIRMALGAERRKIFSMVIGHGLRLATAGLTIGIVAALILTKLLSGFSRLIYGVGTSDPLTFVAVSAVLTGVAILACYIPARRAAKVDPMVALRYD